jgi:hypothetical protein
MKLKNPKLKDVLVKDLERRDWCRDERQGLPEVDRNLQAELNKLLRTGLMDDKPTLDKIAETHTRKAMIPHRAENLDNEIAELDPKLQAGAAEIRSEVLEFVDAQTAAGLAALTTQLRAMMKPHVVLRDGLEEVVSEFGERLFNRSDRAKALTEIFALCSSQSGDGPSQARQVLEAINLVDKFEKRFTAA